ncbi:NAD-dependent epimerase/dehydratase family protein [Streptomyces avermitilis]|uniref:NAD-dependent epimerase/dehydratase family protein n=1 Tax=Streptomyces avermitilis TaxID=33903 RepID=UPI0033AD7F8D
MRVLITGGAGFIGSHTADGLLDRGHEVTVLDALVPPVHADRRFPEHLLERGVRWIDGDVRDRSAWERALDGVDAVYHLAAYQDYLPDFSTFFTTNTASTALLYEVLVARGQRLRRVVVASSQAVYGEGAQRCPECGEDEELRPGARTAEQLERGEWDLLCPHCGAALVPDWTEEEETRPHNAYAISKYAQEQIALALGARYDIPTVVLRYSIVQGSRQSFRNAYSGILRIFAQRILKGRPPVCYEDGRQLRDYVSVHDVVRANLLALDDERVVGQALNVGGGRRVSILEYARLVAECSGVEVAPETPGTYRAGDTRHVFSSIDRMAQLGWKPEVPLREIVREYLDWASAQAGFIDATTDADLRMKSLGTVRQSHPVRSS